MRHRAGCALLCGQGRFVGEAQGGLRPAVRSGKACGWGTGRAAPCCAVRKSLLVRYRMDEFAVGLNGRKKCVEKSGIKGLTNVGKRDIVNKTNKVVIKTIYSINHF